MKSLKFSALLVVSLLLLGTFAVTSSFQLAFGVTGIKSALSTNGHTFPPRLPSHTSSSQIHAKITVTPSLDPAVIKAAILAGGGTGIDPSSVVVTVTGLTSGGSSSVGTYDNPTNTYGIGKGIVISSGDVNAYNDGPNLSDSTSTAYGNTETLAQKALLDPITGSFTHFDVTQIDVTFNMLPGFDHIFFNTVFGSEEYPVYVGSQFIDGFGMYVNGVNIAQVAGLPVNINHPFIGSVTPGTELNGVLGSVPVTPTNTFPGNPAVGPFVYTFSSPVNPTGNTLTFIVADSSDQVLDTTVFIGALGGTPPTAVGGMGIPIDSTALLLAGMQGSPLWIIPAIVIAGAGIGFISYIKSKKKQD